MRKLYDRTRDEQEIDERYEWERPYLQLPVPEFEFREPPAVDTEEEKKENSRVIIIDL